MIRRKATLIVVLWIICVLEFHPFQLAVEAGGGRDPAIVEASVSQESNVKEQPRHNISIVGDEFILDGKTLRIVSGSLHYFRLPASYWRNRLRMLKAAGLNSVSTYVEWSYHEPEERQYQMTGDCDVAQFVRIAAEEGLHVLLRPGPYICAERDLGGLPYWLLSKYPHIKLRSRDPNFINETRIWMAKLFDKLTPLLFGNGGPIIMVQVENEYGSYSSDTVYKEQVRDILREHVGRNALLYTTDGTSSTMIRNGAVADTLTTIDFGVGNNMRIFTALRRYMPRGPLMNSEFYTGWLTHWSERLQRVPEAQVVNSLRDMLDNNINVNMYMFFGGSNFEFSAGANYLPQGYVPDITTYDYDAPISEAGDPTSKYYAIRRLMEGYNPGLKNITPPTPSPKGAYGGVTVSLKINLLTSEGRSKLGKRYSDVTGAVLPTFEKLRQRAGLVLYETVLTNSNSILNIEQPRDRIYVYVDNEFQGLIDRTLMLHMLSLKSKPNSILSLLVENQGRLNYGSRLHDFKGILGEVKYDNKVLDGKWTITGYPLEQVPTGESSIIQSSAGPKLYESQFSLPEGQEPLDTFLDTTCWGKGYVWVNGHNLGRYWPSVGPQVTLYTPGVWLHAFPANNTIQILELEKPCDNLTMSFINTPILDRSASIDSINPEVLIFGTI